MAPIGIGLLVMAVLVIVFPKLARAQTHDGYRAEKGKTRCYPKTRHCWICQEPLNTLRKRLEGNSKAPPSARNYWRLAKTSAR
jgi:hypothetical protein